MKTTNIVMVAGGVGGDSFVFPTYFAVKYMEIPIYWYQPKIYN